MKVKIHLPRKSEADITPSQKQDLEIHPRFYRKTGWSPILYFTTIDSKGNEEQHIMFVHASNKGLKIERLQEVTPACDDDEPVPETEADESEQSKN